MDWRIDRRAPQLGAGVGIKGDDLCVAAGDEQLAVLIRDAAAEERAVVFLLRCRFHAPRPLAGGGVEGVDLALGIHGVDAAVGDDRFGEIAVPLAGALPDVLAPDDLGVRADHHMMHGVVREAAGFGPGLGVGRTRQHDGGVRRFDIGAQLAFERQHGDARAGQLLLVLAGIEHAENAAVAGRQRAGRERGGQRGSQRLEGVATIGDGAHVIP